MKQWAYWNLLRFFKCRRGAKPIDSIPEKYVEDYTQYFGDIIESNSG